MPQVAIKHGSNIVRVIATYRVLSDNANQAREVVREFLDNQELPKNIKMVGKAEVVGLRGLL